jgi:hypothetical protein
MEHESTVTVTGTGAGAGAGIRIRAGRGRVRGKGWAADWKVGQVLAAWLAARVVVGAALGLAHFLATTVAEDTGTRFQTTDLLGWDAGWYRMIADGGYAGAGEESRRFFPLLPLLTRGVAALPGLGGHTGLVLLALVNLAALAFAFALVRLARAEGLDDAATDRLIWLAALAPPAFVLVMGYAEALAGLLAVLVFIGARTRRWELAGLAGLLAGLCRPLGLLLAVPVAIEAARGGLRLRHPENRTRPADPTVRTGAVSVGELARQVAAVLAPVAGTGIYLAWTAATVGDGFAPFTLQRDAALHGSTSNPVEVVVDAVRGTFGGELGTGLHVPWLLLAVVGLLVMARRLPASYTAWCGLVLAAVLTGSNLDSAERYLYGAFPFLVVAALVTGRRTVWTFILTCSAAGMAVYATLAFTLAYVP